MRRIEDGVHLPRPGLCEPVGSGAGAEAAPTGLDDRTLAYVLAAQPVFDQIRRAGAQLAGLLVLAAAGGRSAQDHPMFALAIAAGDEGITGVSALRPPPSGLHHHRHLRLGAQLVLAALDAARLGLHRRDDASLDAILVRLHQAHKELHWAATALPGFAIVDLTQACCAQHTVPSGKLGPELSNYMKGR